MPWSPKKREPRPAGDGRGSQKIIADGNSDGSKFSPQAPKKQAFLRRRCDYARDAVFEEFQYRNARAIDYGDFIDRKPDQRLRLWRAST